MTDKKTPIKPPAIPGRRTGTFDGAKVQKSFTTNNVAIRIGKPKPTTGK